MSLIRVEYILFSFAVSCFELESQPGRLSIIIFSLAVFCGESSRFYGLVLLACTFTHKTAFAENGHF